MRGGGLFLGPKARRPGAAARALRAAGDAENSVKGRRFLPPSHGHPESSSPDEYAVIAGGICSYRQERPANQTSFVGQILLRKE